MDRRTFLTDAALPALYPLRGFAQARRTDVRKTTVAQWRLLREARTR